MTPLTTTSVRRPANQNRCPALFSSTDENAEAEVIGGDLEREKKN